MSTLALVVVALVVTSYPQTDVRLIPASQCPHDVGNNCVGSESFLPTSLRKRLR